MGSINWKNNIFMRQSLLYIVSIIVTIISGLLSKEIFAISVCIFAISNIFFYSSRTLFFLIKLTNSIKSENPEFYKKNMSATFYRKGNRLITPLFLSDKNILNQLSSNVQYYYKQHKTSLLLTFLSFLTFFLLMIAHGL